MIAHSVPRHVALRYVAEHGRLPPRSGTGHDLVLDTTLELVVHGFVRAVIPEGGQRATLTPQGKELLLRWNAPAFQRCYCD